MIISGDNGGAVVEKIATRMFLEAPPSLRETVETFVSRG